MSQLIKIIIRNNKKINYSHNSYSILQYDRITNYIKLPEANITNKYNFYQCNYFHSPISRKKKTDVSVNTIKTFNFNEKAIDMLNTIRKVILPVIEMNNYKLSSNESGDIIVDIDKNKFYRFSICYKTETIRMVSPISGPKEYEFDIEQELWLNTIDRHDMRGIIVRDFLRHSSGLVNF